MARTRSGAALIDDAYMRSDTEGATDRHPRPSVLRYVNQGAAELYDLLIAARGPDYFRKDPAQSITTTADTTAYTLATDFYMLISVWKSGDTGEPLVPFTSHEEPGLRSGSYAVGDPTHYQLRRSGSGANTIAVLPPHDAGDTIVVDYVPAFVDLTDAVGSLFDGINGWEAYVVDFAAHEIAIKDEEFQLAAVLEKSMAKMRVRITGLAPRRDMHRAKRVKDVRGARMWSR